jgi:hypothetical protein
MEAKASTGRQVRKDLRIQLSRPDPLNSPTTGNWGVVQECWFPRVPLTAQRSMTSGDFYL